MNQTSTIKCYAHVLACIGVLSALGGGRSSAQENLISRNRTVRDWIHKAVESSREKLRGPSSG
jgi:hypothetical protein